MWLNRCRLLTQTSSLIYVENSRTKFPTIAFGLTNKPNNFSCQQTKNRSNSTLCLRTRLNSRNERTGQSSASYSTFCRLMSMKKCPPDDKDKNTDSKSSKVSEDKGTDSISSKVSEDKKTDSKSSKDSEKEDVSGRDPSILLISGRQVRQNFHEKCVEKINVQINDELFAAYNYISMASFCNQDNVALSGFAKFFMLSYKEEIEHMEKLISYLNKRGGQLHLTCVDKPLKHEWKHAEELVGDALQMEKDLNLKLLALHTCASQHNDAHLTDFLEEHYLQEQVEAIKVLADLLTTLRRARRDLSVHLVDKELEGGGFSPHGNGK